MAPASSERARNKSFSHTGRSVEEAGADSGGTPKGTVVVTGKQFCEEQASMETEASTFAGVGSCANTQNTGVGPS